MNPKMCDSRPIPAAGSCRVNVRFPKLMKMAIKLSLFLLLTAVGRGESSLDRRTDLADSFSASANDQSTRPSPTPPPPSRSPTPTPIPSPTPTPTPTPTPNPPLINPDDILVSIGRPALWGGLKNEVREFTPAGSLVQVISFDYNHGNYPQTEYLRDIVVDQDQSIAAYNGSFAPFLTCYSSILLTSEHSTLAGWSTANVSSYGGIAAYKHFVYVTDMLTGSGGQASGIIRFDTSNNTAIRFAEGTDFKDVNMGLDGKLYAVLNSRGLINVYNPETMGFLRQIFVPAIFTFNEDIRGVAVDQAGRLFICGWHDMVFRLDGTGALEVSRSTGFFNLTDIDINETGRLIIGSGGPENGKVILTDSTLNSFSSFVAITDSNSYVLFVAFARPVAISIPSPTPIPFSNAPE